MPSIKQTDWPQCSNCNTSNRLWTIKYRYCKLLTQSSSTDHVKHPTRSTHHDVNPRVKFPHVFSDIGTTNTCMALGTHKVTQSDNHLLNLLTKKITLTGDQGFQSWPQFRANSFQMHSLRFSKKRFNFRTTCLGGICKLYSVTICWRQKYLHSEELMTMQAEVNETFLHFMMQLS
jgi:hypothetical protein